MFLEGCINEDLEPIVNNVFVVGREVPIALKAVLDTGFNGAFSLPRVVAAECELQYFGYVTIEFGDGSQMLEREYIGQIIIHGRSYFVQLTLTDADTALIGMQLLKDKVAIINLKTNRLRVEE